MNNPPSSSGPSIFTTHEAFPHQPPAAPKPRTSSSHTKQDAAELRERIGEQPVYTQPSGAWAYNQAAHAANSATSRPPWESSQSAATSPSLFVPSAASTPGGLSSRGSLSSWTDSTTRPLSALASTTNLSLAPPLLAPPPPSALTRKRPHTATGNENTTPTLAPQTAFKRRRPSSRPPKLSLERPLFPPRRANDEPPSPLFFSSRHAHLRAAPPPRFSSAEAAAAMLSQGRAEERKGVKTVSLARGVVESRSGRESAAGSPVLVGKGADSCAVWVESVSPEAHSGRQREVDAALGELGVVELLEQDDRLTFIVDLGESLGPAPLSVVFSNAALRAYPGMDALVSGRGTGKMSPGSQLYEEFRRWVLGSSQAGGEESGGRRMTRKYAGIAWSCSTLRQRFRVVSGGFVPSSDGAALRGQDAGRGYGYGHSIQRSSPAPEPGDYFGTAELPARPADRQMALDDTGAEVPALETAAASSSGVNPSRATRLPPNANSQRFFAPERNIASTIDMLPAHDSRIPCVSSDSPSFDWTRLPVTSSMPPHIQFARSVDWSQTSLGPIEHWNPDLRQMCNLIMASPHPAAMYWGPDLVTLYNEAYVLLAGQKHPKLMGQSYRDAWHEIWDNVKDEFAVAFNTGKATMKDDDCLFITRGNNIEEAYFSWSIIPMVGTDGLVMGLWNPAFERTALKVSERRMNTLYEVGERTASARNVKEFWAQALGAFELNHYDSPFLLFYSAGEEHDSDGSSVASNSTIPTKQCVLEGALGVPEGHPAAQDVIDLKTGTEGFGPVFREAMRADKPTVLEVGSPDLPENLLHGLQWRGFGDAVRSVVVCPIHTTSGEDVLGFLVLGVNPRRPYDDDYSIFIQLLSRQLATTLASVVLFEREIKRGQRAAELAELEKLQLANNLRESESKFARMAEWAPVGMFIANSHGQITFANDTYYAMSGAPRHRTAMDTWMEVVHAHDLAAVRASWGDLVVACKAVSFECRFKTQWEDRNGNLGDAWVLFSGYPETHEDGALKSIFASITNISQQKWAEGLQKRKMEEAVELKRQQENFIDITSHELRNPLSAIFQSSDEIASSLSRFKESGAQVMSDDLLTSCLDAAQIISLCSQHQKRIVDDVLTLSKLDSRLLVVTPVDAQPLNVVQRALKMHEGELRAADIAMNFAVDPSYHALALDWVRLDPSRVLQVLINLTTNAIKFTGTERKRTITVTISAHTTRPSLLPDTPVTYFPTRNHRPVLLNERDWGAGDPVYIHFSVRDTGRGLSTAEKDILFQRFSQASPRTHVQYGGSGLGLFISRELTELQGGEIGVQSQAGIGSTFAFYVIARRSAGPTTPAQPLPLPHRFSTSSTPIPALAATPQSDTDTATAHAVQQAARQLASVSGLGGDPLDAATLSPSATDDPPRAFSTAAAAPRVLIVEDNLVNQRVLQKQLRRAGAQVHVANHGGEALERVRGSTYWAGGSGGAGGGSGGGGGESGEGGGRVHSGPAGGALELGVVLMDQEMPVMDGLTCTRTMREWERKGWLRGHVPIIAVTANARAEQVAAALAAGMDDVVSKPFRTADLLPKIEELLAQFPLPRPAGAVAEARWGAR